MKQIDESDFTEARAIAAEGARVGIVTCKLCGSALLIDPADKESFVAAHVRWHDSLGPPPEEGTDES